MRRVNTAQWDDKSQRWKINVQKGGKRKSFYSSLPGRNGQREANAKADAWLDNNVQPNIIKADALLQQYLANIAAKTSNSNFKKEAYHVDNFILPAIGKKKMDRITEQDLQNIIDNAYRYVDRHGQQQTRSKKTLQNIRATIMAWLKYCRKMGATTLRPEDLSIPKGARLKGKQILQPDALKTLFAVDTTVYRNQRIFDAFIYAYRFIVTTGLRPGELRGLRLQDVEGDNIHLHGAINIYGEHTQGKNQNAVRGFVLSALAKQILDAHISAYPPIDYIFVLPPARTFLKHWKRYCTSNGIPPISLYELRHTFVSVASSLPQGEIKALVGHSTNMDTFGIYGHEINGQGRAVASKVNDCFDSLLSTG